MDMKGGCSPQNIFKSVQVINEFSPGGNKIVTNCDDLMRRGVAIAITFI